MKTLNQILKRASEEGWAIGHFNVANLEMLKAVAAAAKSAKAPVMIGTSEGEGDFIGFRQAAALVKSLKKEFDYPIFINGDHIRSLEKARAIVEAGYDAIIFDASELPFEENLQKIDKISNENILIFKNYRG